MILRIAAFHTLEYGGEIYRGGDTFEVPDESAAQWLRTGLVVPADDDWRGVVPQPAEPALKPRQTHSRRKHRKGRERSVCPCPAPARKPGKALATCAVSGCFCQVVSGKCRAHARSNSQGERYRDSYTDTPGLRRRWAATSRAYLRANPLCVSERCSAIPAPMRPAATEVDHIDGLGLQGPRAFDPDNWQALCHSCHSRKTAGESFGH